MKPIFLAAVMGSVAVPALGADRADVIQTYAAIGEAVFGDTLDTARALQVAVDALVATPSDETLSAARAAWLAARVPYPQTEVFRFGNPIVDDWEGRVNSWPLDEGLIDYVAQTYGGPTDENRFAALNVIATPVFTLSGTEVDATRITPELIAGTLHEADGIEANVASGYHAIEFLLWGQDLNGTGPGAGNRPYTDYVTGAGCTGGHCDRRGDYLRAATALLVSDTDEMARSWAEGGSARAALAGDPDVALAAMLTGMGSLSYGELAGERIKLGLMLNDPEEEQDCFSDNTHNSHYYDAIGIRNVYQGRYQRLDGRVVEGPSLADLVAAADPALDAELRARLDASVAALGAIKAAAENGFAYDQMLAAGDAEGSALLTAAIDALIAQTAPIERAAAALGLGAAQIEGSDSLDSPAAVFQ